MIYDPATTVRFWSKVTKTDGCWLFKGSGYPRFRANGKTIKAHRFSYIAHFGSIPEGMLVCHKCDVRNCVNPEHLFIGTYDDNNKDRSKKGRTGRLLGDNHPSSRLTTEQVIAIKTERASGTLTMALAKKYGISKRHVRSIVRGECWSHLSQLRPLPVVQGENLGNSLDY